MLSFGCVAWINTKIDFPEIKDQKIKRAKKIIKINRIKIESENNACHLNRGRDFIRKNIADEAYFFHFFGLPHKTELLLKDKKYKFKFYHKHSEFQSIEIPSKTIYSQVIGVPLLGDVFADTDAKHYCDQADNEAQAIAFSIFYEKLPLEKKYLYWEDVATFYKEEVKSLLFSNPGKIILAINRLNNPKLQKCLSETLQKNPDLMLSSIGVINNQYSKQENSELNYYNKEVIETYHSEQALIDKKNPVIISLFTVISIDYCNEVSQICQIKSNNKTLFIGEYERKNIVQWDKIFYLHQYNKNSSKEDYLQYYNDYPESLFKEKALLEWAKMENTEAAYLNFLEKAMDAEYIKNAKALYEPVLYNLAISNDQSLIKVDSYIERYPDGIYINEVRRHREKIFYNLALKNKSVKYCDQYLSQYPKGKFKTKIVQLKENIEYNNTIKSSSLSTYDRFLKEYPKSKYVTKVKTLRKKLYLRLEKEAFDRAVSSDTLYSYQQFINNYPNGKYTKKARSLYQKEYNRIDKKFSKAYDRAINRSGSNIVFLTYKTSSGTKAFEVIDEVKDAMHVRDPMGFFNPYWVTSFPDYGAKGNRGVVIGRWYKSDYSGFSDWKSMLRSEMSNIYGVTSYNTHTGSSGSNSSSGSSGRSSSSSRNCDSISNYAARQACRGDCGSIDSYNIRKACQGNCSVIDSYVLRKACQGNCSGIDDYASRKACESCGGGNFWVTMHMLGYNYRCK
jgi:hypothetical protein